jgi:predicted MPP superfamily phosphohydrolase
MVAAEPRGAERGGSLGVTNRRSFAVGGLLGGLCTVGLAGLQVYEAYALNPFAPQLERVALPLPAGHEALAGLTIGFVADTHVGPYVAPEDVLRATTLLARERPDIILLGGDYISASPRFAAPAAAVLGELVRAAPLGGYAVLGNHDAGERGRAERVTAALESAGIRVLRNAATAIHTGRGTLWIAGVDEALMARANPEVTFAGIPSDVAALALWHEPDYADRTAALGAFAQLSGHSHGGQVRLPGIGPLLLPLGGQRYVMGLNEAGGMPVYTTRGVGVFLPPFRYNCPPEVTLVSLVAPSMGAHTTT